MEDIKPDISIDTKGLQCPRPLLKAKQALEGMQSGQVLEVVADDRTTKSTFPAYLKHSGDEMLKTYEKGVELFYYIKKK